MNLPRFLSALAWMAGACTPLVAQATTQSLNIGGSGARGCFDPNADPPLLSNGTPASGTLDFTYDEQTGVLQLDVQNTSAVTPGVPNPLITRIAFNLPQGAVDGVTLLSQTGAGGNVPSFQLQADFSSGIKMACFGDFTCELTSDIGNGAIGNPAADTWAAPSGSVVVGPVSFRMQLSGPATGLLSSYILALGFSRNAPQRPVNAVAKFQAGGAGGAGSDFVSNTTGPAGGCLPNLWLDALPRIGSTPRFCISGAPTCVGCWAGSLFPGPTTSGPITIPIGVPILFDLPIPALPAANTLCFPVSIPNDPSIVGLTIYMAVAMPGSGPTKRGLLDTTPRFNVKILPLTAR